MELCGSPTYQSSSGLLDAFNIEDFPPLLEVSTELNWATGQDWAISAKFKILFPTQIQFPALDIRLSYNDVQLFLAIAKSIPTTGSTGPSDTATETESSAPTASTDAKHSFRLKTEALLGLFTNLKKYIVFIWIP